MIEIGIASGAHGVKGALKIRLFVSPEDFIIPGEPLLLRRRETPDKTFIVSQVMQHNQALLVWLEGIHSREEAKALSGSRILVEEERFPTLPEGQHYWFQIVGLKVLTSDGEYLGIIDYIIETGANDVFAVKNDTTGKETLVPDLAWVVLKVDLETKTMVVDLPEGL